MCIRDSHGALIKQQWPDDRDVLQAGNSNAGHGNDLLQVSGIAIPYQFFQMIPYVATVVVLSVIGTKQAGPKALSLIHIYP